MVLAIKKKQLGDNHLETATSLNNLALLYKSQGRYPEAEPFYKEALAIIKLQLGGRHPDTAISLGNLAELYRSQGRYTEAEPLLKEALAIYEKQLGGRHPYTAISLGNLAELYRSQGRYTEAEPLLKEALTITKKQLGDRHPYTATSLNNLAELYRVQGRYPEAEPLLKEALAIRKQQLGSRHPDTAISLGNLAKLYYYQGRYTEAESHLKEALAITKKQLGDTHPYTATSLDNLAKLYYYQRRYTEAEPLLKEALAITKKQLGDRHPYTATSLNNLAELYRVQGRYSEAELLYQKALAIYKEQLGDNHLDTARSLNNLAALYYSQGRYTESELFYQQALAIWKQQLGGRHPDTATSLNNLAALYESQGDIPRAMEYLTKGLEVQEFNLSENLIAGDEKQKQDYIATVSGTTSWVISLNLQSAPNNPEATRLAFKTILQRKGRILDVLTNSLQILREQIDDPESQELLTQFIAIRTQQANLNFKKPEDFPSPEVYRQLLAELNAKAKQLEDQLSRRSAEFRALSQPVTLEAIQKLIPPDTALVELVYYKPFNPKATKDSEKWGEPRYAAYILYSQGEPQAIDLGEAEIIDKAVTSFRKNLQPDVQGNPNSTIKQVKASAQKLDTLVMQPIRQRLKTSKILLSPDGTLNLVPFEALVDENNQYLITNYHITYLTSGRDLLRLQAKSSSQQPPLVVAAPNFNQAEGFIPNNKKPNNSPPPVSLSQRRYKPLEGTAEQAKAIQEFLSLSNNQVFIGKKATENVIKKVNRPNFLLIATHGLFEPINNNSEVKTVLDNPLLRSGLVLAGIKRGQSGGDDDGFLSALEVTGLNLVGTQLVVLSACDTGVGDISTGEGIYGLRRAFVIAGSESQLISLWKVSEQATKELMKDYYKRLKSGEGRSKALRETQSEMLTSKDYQHPFYWASFILSGDWTPMQFKSN